jgi:hypothetical protein
MGLSVAAESLCLQRPPPRFFDSKQYSTVHVAHVTGAGPNIELPLTLTEQSRIQRGDHMQRSASNALEIVQLPCKFSSVDTIAMVI